MTTTPTTRPISLSDEQLAEVMRLAEPLQSPDRSAFLTALAAELQGASEIGDGQLHRVATALLRTGQYWKPPASTADPYPLRKALRTP